jgi:restriction system protein
LEVTVAQRVAKFINPVLNAIKKLGGSARPAEVCATVIKDMGLETSPMLEQTLKSGVSKFENKIAWVRWHLVLAGYIDRSHRGVWTLTEKGRNSAALSDAQIHQLLLDVQRQSKKEREAAEGESPDATDSEEQELEESGYKTQVLDIVRGLPASGFERLCQRLLRESGFERVEVTGRPADGGIDGIGVLKVLFQCKRYSGTVSASQVRDFHGAMQGRADKGIILTTGSFSAEALKEAVRDGVPPIELVDGEHLVELFERLELGLAKKVTQRVTYDVDPGFFEEFRR